MFIMVKCIVTTTNVLLQHVAVLHLICISSDFYLYIHLIVIRYTSDDRFSTMILTYTNEKKINIYI